MSEKPSISFFVRPLSRKDFHMNFVVFLFSFLYNFSKHSKLLSLLLLVSLLTDKTMQKRIIRARDDCYDNERNPRFCQAPFDNIALMKRVCVSETCGFSGPENFWSIRQNGDLVTREFATCRRRGRESHPARFLTDIHDDGNTTYWQSKSIESRRNVTLVISFHKQFELSYISLQFHSPRPESMVIYKSVDHGRNWIPFQYYARDCRATFDLPNHARSNHSSSYNAVCLEDSSDPLPFTGGRIHFTPIRDRPTENNFNNDQAMHEWVTATDIKFVLISVNDVSGVLPSFSGGLSKRGADKRARRFFVKKGVSGGFKSSSENRELHKSPGKLFSHRKGTRRSAPSKTIGVPPSTVLQYGYGLSPFFAINDIAIGGRCKCNGHASRCIIKKGRLVCDCRHNTDGPNCERCKSFHFDRPWQRATPTSANECIPCKCNLHAKKCRFNADLFAKSGGVSGGVCQKCRHHTTGRFCNHCKPGYFKNNKTKSIAHRKICKSCGCHPVGAAGKICDPTTGQCPCKDGVAGKKCNRCAKGFVQTSSRIAPCIKLTSPSSSTDFSCVPCKKTRPGRLTIKKLCKYDYVLQVKVLGQTASSKWTQMTLDVMRDFTGNDFPRQRLVDVKTKPRILSCFCPKLKNNRKYLLMGTYDPVGIQPVPLINRNTIALRWRKKFRRKLNSLSEKIRTSNHCSLS